jgi:hypothetical protein
MIVSKILPFVLLVSIGIAAPVTISSSAHAASVPCTAGPPVCGNPDPGNPGKHGGDNPDPGASAIPTDAMIIGCRIWADPKPMPDDLKFRNIGGKTIPAGTRVYWLVKATGDHGYYYPPVDILPGKELPDLEVLKTVTETTNGCRSMIM